MENVITLKKQSRRDGETNYQYLQRAARSARRLVNKWCWDSQYSGFHPSFLVHHCMEAVEEAYGLDTYGVEHIGAGRGRKSPAITYLNTGDSYGMTVMYVRNRFVVGSWGDIVEAGNYN